MTPRPGLVVVTRDLPRKRVRKGEGGKLPPGIAIIVRETAEGGIVIRLRVGGTGAQQYAPRSRVCEPANVVRPATDRERFHGMVIDPLTA